MLAQPTSKLSRSQKEILDCLQHGYVGLFSDVESSYGPFVRTELVLSGVDHKNVRFSSVKALAEKGLVKITYFSAIDGSFKLSEDA
jgi:hypothetical protein